MIMNARVVTIILWKYTVNTWEHVLSSTNKKPFNGYFALCNVLLRYIIQNWIGCSNLQMTKWLISTKSKCNNTNNKHIVANTDVKQVRLTGKESTLSEYIHCRMLFCGPCPWLMTAIGHFISSISWTSAIWVIKAPIFWISKSNVPPKNQILSKRARVR